MLDKNENWEYKTLNYISENLDSKRVPITKGHRKKGSVPYYGASGVVDYVSDYLFDEDLLCISEDGANLLARTYPIAFSISGKTWVNNHAHVLRFKNITTQRFVELYLNSISLDDYVSGMAQPKLNQSMLNKILIPFPSLPVQKRIVAILDKAFASIDKAKANAEQNLKNAKELFESYLQGVLDNRDKGWKEKPLGEVIQLEYGKALTDLKRNLLGKYPIYGANGIINRTNEYYYDKESIIVGRKGSAGELNLTEVKFWPLDVTYFVTYDDKIYNLQFIYYLLSNLRLPKLAKGVKPGINRNEVYALQVRVPLLQEQQVIVQKLDALSAKIKKLEGIYQAKINNLEELKKSILQKAFSGELTRAEVALA